MTRRPIVFVAAMLIAAGPWRSATAGEVIPQEKVAEAVVVQDVSALGGTVTGVLVNRTQSTVRDVKLLVRFDWRWQNELRPGEDNPGFSAFHTVLDEIPAGKTTSFTYSTDGPIPERSDGHFEVSVEVLGFTRAVTAPTPTAP